MELLTALEYQTMELAAIRQAAKDFVTLKEAVRPLFSNTHINRETELAYNNLKELVS